jgi:hypothetical protein
VVCALASRIGSLPLKPRLLLILPGLWLLTVAAAPATPTPVRTPTPTPVPTPKPTPAPTPTPSVGQVNVAPAFGPPGSTVSVSGSAFRPGEQITIFWDTPDKGLGATTADGQGNFKTDVTTPAGDPGSSHSICADEKNPGPRCAVFREEAAATPTPAASPDATPAPTATTVAPTGAPGSAPSSPASRQPVSAISVLLQPPFVFFPILLLLAALGGAGYWIWTGTRGARPAPVPAARVVHRSAHPPGTDPEAEPAATVAPPAAAPAAPVPTPAPAPAAAQGAPRPLAGDDPLDLPQPGD